MCDRSAHRIARLGRFGRRKQAGLTRLEDLKQLGGDTVPLPRDRQLDEGIVDALIRELETAEVGGDREPGFEIQVRANGRVLTAPYTLKVR